MICVRLSVTKKKMLNPEKNSKNWQAFKRQIALGKLMFERRGNVDHIEDSENLS